MLLLLDIDGVMVPANSWKKPEFLNDGFPAFSKNAIEALQRIIAEMNAQIMLTTSHKSKYSLQQWSTIFEVRGIKLKNIDRLPENIENLNRKEEILHWFNHNKISENFVIIDDDKSLNGLPRALKQKLILTSGALGLTNQLVTDYIKNSGVFV